MTHTKPTREPVQLPLFPRRAVNVHGLPVRLDDLTMSLLFSAALVTMGLVLLLRLLEIYAAYIMTPMAGRLDEMMVEYHLGSVLILAFTVCCIVLARKRAGTKWGIALRLLALLAGGIFVIDLLYLSIRSLSRPDLYKLPWFIPALGMFSLLLALWKLPALQLAGVRDKLELKDYLTLKNSLRGTYVQLVGGLLVLSGLYYTAQNLRLSQENVRVSLVSAEAQRIERAAEHLKDDSLGIRLVALNSLKSLAMASADNYTLVTELLSIYVRERSPWKADAGEAGPRGVKMPADIEAALDFFKGGPPEELFERELDLFFADSARRRHVRFKPPRVNLSGTDLRGGDLRVVSLSGADLSATHLDGSLMTFADLRAANLEGAVLRGANVRAARLDSATLRGAVFDAADVAETSFYNADLEGADLRGARNLKAEQLSEAKNRDKALLPPELTEGAPK